MNTSYLKCLLYIIFKNKVNILCSQDKNYIVNFKITKEEIIHGILLVGAGKGGEEIIREFRVLKNVSD